MVCVFIPTTPNPTSGFIVLVPRSQAIELDMSVDAAMKMIVTLGVVVPTTHRQHAGAQGRRCPGSNSGACTLRAIHAKPLLRTGQ